MMAMTAAQAAEILRKLDRLEDAWMASEEANGRAGFGLTLNSPARARHRVKALWNEMHREREAAEPPFETREGAA